MKKVLISAPYMLKEREFVSTLLAKYPLEVIWANVHERLSEDELKSALRGIEGIICGDDRFTEHVFQGASSLKTIVKWGTGIDSINAPLAKKYGITVHRTPGAFTQPVADSTLAYMLAFARNVLGNDTILKSGGWEKPAGYSLFEKTFGIVGFGEIGQAVAKRLQAFDATVITYDIRKIEPAILKQLNTAQVSLDELLERSDFVTLHCDLNESSLRLLDERAFARMKRGPIVINTARGPIIDEEALISALQTGRVKGAGLDVFVHEPLASDSPLRKMSNVFLAAHNSNSSPTCWRRVHENSVRMLAEGLGI